MRTGAISPRLGGNGKGDPVVATNADGRLEVFINTTSSSLWHIWEMTLNGNWSNGSEIFGDVDYTPAVARNSDGRLVVMTGDTEGSYWWTIQNTAGRDSLVSMVVPSWRMQTQPVMTTNFDGSLGVFGVRADGNLYYSAQLAPGAYNWSNWTLVGSGTVQGIPQLRWIPTACWRSFSEALTMRCGVPAWPGRIMGWTG